MMDQQASDPPAIIRKKPVEPEEEEAVFARMRDLVIGQQNAAELQKLKAETRERVIDPRPMGGIEVIKVLYGRLDGPLAPKWARS